MLEIETTIDFPEIIQQTPMYPDRKVEIKEWKTFKVCGDGLVVDAEGKEYQLNSLEKLSDLALNRVCIFSEDQNNFNQIIKHLGEDVILEIANNRKVKKNGVTVSIQDNVGREFSFRKGNCFGWLKNIPDVFEESVDVKIMNSQYEEILSTLRKNGFAINMLSSAPKMAQTFFHSNLRGFIPSLEELDRKHWERASYATKGGRMESSRLGEFNKVYDYDMVSAYGSMLRELPCISPYYMKWFSARKYHPEADMAFCLCEVNIPSSFADGFAPFRMDIGNVFFPYGKFGTWLAKPEIDVLLTLGIEVKIREGSFGIITKDFRPFEKIVDGMWDLRKTPSCYKVAKRMLSMGWGKFLSEYGSGKVSSLWNPIYAAHITSMARARLLELTRLVGDSLVVFSIDGFSSKRPLPEHLLSEDLGGMKLHYIGPMISYTDFFRDIGQKKSWEITDDGVYFEGAGYVSIFGMKVFRYEDICKPIQVSRCVPFGSTKRGCKDLKLKDILNNEIRLNPPSVKEMRDIYETTIERDILAMNPFLLDAK